uniref:Uncharacterized protein n=2 Tax=Oryza TaxID=4527 RepID=A0A0D3FSI8_9ORYZ
MAKCGASRSATAWRLVAELTLQLRMAVTQVVTVLRRKRVELRGAGGGDYGGEASGGVDSGVSRRRRRGSQIRSWVLETHTEPRGLGAEEVTGVNP